MTTFQDQTLTCEECKQAFIFTAGEQEFFHEKGFSNIPKRCIDCRTKRKAQSRQKRPAPRSGAGPRSSDSSARFPAVCSRCGASFDAPFQPKPDRPILCRPCFKPAR